MVLMVFSCFQSLWAYSSIWKLDGWDTARLKGSGITVASWKHETISEEPAMRWVEITFDCTKLGKEQNVLMTVHVIGKDWKTIAATRMEHRKGDSGKLRLLFAISEEQIENSYVQILLPELHSKMSERAVGDSGLGGYSLQVSRILQLAAADSAPKTEPTKPEAENQNEGAKSSE